MILKALYNFLFFTFSLRCYLSAIFVNESNESCEKALDDMSKAEFNYIELFLTHKIGDQTTAKNKLYKNDNYEINNTSIILSLNYQNIKAVRTNITERNQTIFIIDYLFCTAIECFDERRLTFRNVSMNVEILWLSYNQIDCLKNRTFYGLQNLKELLLTNNKLLYIESNAFEGLANLKKLDLSQNSELRNIYTNAFSGLKRLCDLKITNSFVNIINERTFSDLFSLETFDLSISTNLREIKDYGFYGLTNLNSLDLAYATQLSIIGERSFYGLVNLKTLKFNQCKSLNILSLKKILKHLDQLENLEMVMLDLENLGADLFINLGKLKVLNFYGNKLSNVKNAFKGLSSLEELKFEKNNFSVLSASSFYSLSQSKLKKLDLRSCKITVIKSEAFYGLENLLELILNSNDLVAIEPFTFVGLTSLTYLNMKEMLSMDRIKSNSFYGLENLKHLDLTYSGIKRIFNYTFQYLTELHSLKMGIENDNQGLEIMSYGLQHFQNLNEIDFQFKSVKMRERAFYNFSTKYKRIDMKFKLVEFFRATDFDIYNFCGILKLRPTKIVKSFQKIHFYKSSNLNIIDESSFRNDSRFENIKNPICYLTLFFIRFELLFKFYDNDNVNRFFFECLDYELEGNFLNEKDCQKIY